MSRFATALCASVLGLSTAVFAAPMATGVSGGGSFGVFYSSPTIGDVVGFSFTADLPLMVSDLGIIVDPSDGILDSSHEVGLWRNSDQTLLASVTVSGSDPITDGFHYVALGSPIMLAAGQDYTLGAAYTDTDGDSYSSNPTVTFGTGISNTVAVFPSAGNLGFAFPTEQSLGNVGRFGPNAQYTVIPEPATLALLGLGGLMLRRRR